MPIFKAARLAALSADIFQAAKAIAG